ncbi:MAG: hypothetical protein CVV47_12215 [Spirochaetae bacterium HGW-Spirochaetae-3]|nr:MAG: hypothetical protein CVV47_12215 [Spirochaetae bacterium HGW-Spirochaetae-3]
MSVTYRATTIPERNKKPGVRYAFSPDGIELPVIDVDHPAFCVDPAALIAATRPGAMRKPSRIQTMLMRPMLRGSMLARAISGAGGGYASGLGTYMLKLGPDNLGDGWAKKIDRAIASSLPCLSARMRLEATARLEADALIAMMATRGPGARLHLLNIAGGPSSDTLNALMMARRREPGLVEGADIGVEVLDLDGDGPEFGARSLAALMTEGGPLAGLLIRVERRAYDWNDVRPLAERLRSIADGDSRGGDPGVVIASEGGLFEYASDEAILATLEAVRVGAPRDAVVVGTIGKATGPALSVNEATGTAARLRGLEAFLGVARSAGWEPAASADCPLSHCLVLRML